MHPPNEAIVSIATEIQLAETSGMLNIGMPSSVVKLLRQKFDQGWSARRLHTSDEETDRTLAHVGDAAVRVDARVEGSAIRFADLLELSEGDILQLEQRTSDPVSLLVNGLPKYEGSIQLSGGRIAVAIGARV